MHTYHLNAIKKHKIQFPSTIKLKFYIYIVKKVVILLHFDVTIKLNKISTLSQSFNDSRVHFFQQHSSFRHKALKAWFERDLSELTLI